MTHELINSTEGVALIGDDFGGRVALDVAVESEPGLVQNVVLFDLVPHEWSLQNTAVKAVPTAAHTDGLCGASSRRTAWLLVRPPRS